MRTENGMQIVGSNWVSAFLLDDVVCSIQKCEKNGNGSKFIEYGAESKRFRRLTFETRTSKFRHFKSQLTYSECHMKHLKYSVSFNSMLINIFKCYLLYDFEWSSAQCVFFNAICRLNFCLRMSIYLCIRNAFVSAHPIFYLINLFSTINTILVFRNNKNEFSIHKWASLLRSWQWICALKVKVNQLARQAISFQLKVRAKMAMTLLGKLLISMKWNYTRGWFRCVWWLQHSNDE